MFTRYTFLYKLQNESFYNLFYKVPVISCPGVADLHQSRTHIDKDMTNLVLKTAGSTEKFSQD